MWGYLLHVPSITLRCIIETNLFVTVIVFRHPLESARELYLSFDYCHVLKNIRSQFLDVKRVFKNNENFILPDFLR